MLPERRLMLHARFLQHNKVVTPSHTPVATSRGTHTHSTCDSLQSSHAADGNGNAACQLISVQLQPPAAHCDIATRQSHTTSTLSLPLTSVQSDCRWSLGCCLSADSS
jgi:hypothetical protein